MSEPGFARPDLCSIRTAGGQDELAAAAASDFAVLTNHVIARRLPHEQLSATQISQSYPSSRTEWLLS